MQSIFSIRFETENDITIHEKVIVAYLDPNEDEQNYILAKCDKALFLQSIWCKKNSKVMTDTELVVFNKNKIKLYATQLVIIFPEKTLFFESKFINTIDLFYEAILIADKYLLDISYLLSKAEYRVWLLIVRERQQNLWKSSSVLLTNVGQKRFMKKKFNSITGTQSNAYGFTSKGYPKEITVKSLKANHLISKEDLSDMITKLMEFGEVNFVNKIIAILGSSIEYCDLIFNNARLLEIVGPISTIYACTFYCFRIFYLEELSINTEVNLSHRFIMDLKVMEALPNYVNIKLMNNPYMVAVLEGVNYTSNLILPYNFQGVRGLYNLDRFRARFDEYSNNLFKFISWEKTAVCGSTMTACAIINPLENLFRSTEDYFHEYYPSRNAVTKLPKSNAAKAQQINNLFKYDSSSESSDSEVEDEKESEGTTDEDFVDIDVMIETTSNEEFDRIASAHFEAILKANNGKYDLVLTRKETENKYKWIISGGPRTIDMFSVNSIPGVISKFHLGCVRAWYDGSNVYGFPSFVIAAKIGINIDTRWVSCNKDLRDVILKDRKSVV